MSVIAAWLKRPFWQRVLSGFVLGALAGWALGEQAALWFGPLGQLYVQLIKLIAVPLVLFAVMHAVASLGGGGAVAALGGRTLLWFAITAILAVLMGLATASLLQPGVGLTPLSPVADYAPREIPSTAQVLLGLIPSNPFAALAEGKILQIIVLAGLLGFGLLRLGERGAQLRTLVGQGRELMIEVTRIVLQFTPLGTFGLIAALVGSYGFERLLPLAGFVLTLYLACALHIALNYGGLLALHGLDPRRFLRRALPAMQLAFVSSSSYATLPASLRAVQDLGVDKDYAAFAVPLAASIKMDGCGAIFPAVTALFVAQYFGLELSAAQYLSILLASVLGSFGTAGVPGTAMVMVTLVLSAAGLPLEGIGYLVAIDRVLDMMRTLTNVTGQMLVPVLVARETGLLDTDAYQDTHSVSHAPVASDSGSDLERASCHLG